MTKLTKALLLAALLIAAPISMAKADNDVGCGLGTEIWKGNKGLHFKLAASITNSFAMQSISITFGLLNCSNGQGAVTASAKTRHFAATTFDNLARDAALGGGESLDTLATLLEVPAADRRAFAALTQRNFDVLFPSDRANSDEMLSTLASLMQADEQFFVYTQS